jgi:hypothetical protein
VQGRKAVLVVLAKDADTLSKWSIEAPEVYADIMRSIDGFREHAKGLLSFAECALLRLQIADCREVLARHNAAQAARIAKARQSC